MKKALMMLWAILTTQTVRLENVAMVAGDGDGEAQIGEGLANEILPGEEWIQITPHGEFPHPLGLQRVDAEATRKMANSFHSLRGKLKRRFRGVPIYVGHPDVPGLENEYTDKKAYGWFNDLEARADGLYGKPDWSEEGAALVKNKHYRFPSGYWDAEEVGAAKGKPIYQPNLLFSVGLTNRPRIPVPALSNADDQTKGNEMNNGTISLAVVAALLGVNADEAAVTNKINELRGGAGKITALENAETTSRTGLESEKTEHGKTKTALSNAVGRAEKAEKERNRLALENAISAGRLTPAERADWEGKLSSDYDAHAAALLKKEKAMNTRSGLGNIGERRAGLENAQERALAQFHGKVAGFKKEGLDHHDAWMAAKAAHPELVTAMESCPDGAQD